MLTLKVWLKRRPERAGVYTAYSIAFGIAHRILKLLDVEVVDITGAKLRARSDGKLVVVKLDVDTSFKLKGAKELGRFELKCSEAHLAFTAKLGQAQLSGVVIAMLGQKRSQREVNGDLVIGLSPLDGADGVELIDKDYIDSRLSLLAKKIAWSLGPVLPEAGVGIKM